MKYVQSGDPINTPKLNIGRRLGEGAWQDDEKWVFVMTERGTLDAFGVQVPSNCSILSLIPHINEHCLTGTFSCSDGWKAYTSLPCFKITQRILLTLKLLNWGHTQTIEGFWRQCKASLSSFGFKPKYFKTHWWIPLG